ncbi:Phage integrase family protein [Mycobacterium tuberculosis]|nr:Phage integrase family protein [Mycobacterium tuberculosis]
MTTAGISGSKGRTGTGEPCGLLSAAGFRAGASGGLTAAERSTARASSANLTRRYLTHAELLMLARATGRFETLTLVLGYCGLRRFTVR